jgi:arylsulfatase A-like enzyme
MDSLARDGVQFTQFHVSPVCSPTRSSLMTGRWNYRTGVVDTYIGRSLMRPDEVTLPECLRAAGYRTGIFGKWHLGDNAPMRAMDKGFEECLTLRGGGLAQPSSPPGTGYFDPPLEHNGKPVRPKGYCTDIFFDAAMGHIEANRERPFFTYIACNAPHTPLEIGEEWASPFRGKGLGETTEKVYGMVSNVDYNTGRLLAHLRKLGLERDTIVLFFTDNGPQQPRFNATMRGLKGSVYQGGIRVPCFLRWPGRIKGGSSVDFPAAHVDLMPTLLEACGAKPPRETALDGKSLLPLISGERSPDNRALFFQWHRGDAPERWKQCAVRQGRWKLVDGKELYDLTADPAESRDIAATHAGDVKHLRLQYERWFESVTSRGFDPPRIWVGSEREDPVLLTRQDWRGPRAGWADDSLGHYEVEVRRAGLYRVTLRFPEVQRPTLAALRCGDVEVQREAPAGASELIFNNLDLPAEEMQIEGLLREGHSTRGAHYIELKHETR